MEMIFDAQIILNDRLSVECICLNLNINVQCYGLIQFIFPDIIMQSSSSNQSYSCSSSQSSLEKMEIEQNKKEEEGNNNPVPQVVRSEGSNTQTASTNHQTNEGRTNIQFYEEYKKLYRVSYNIKLQEVLFLKEKNKLHRKIIEIQKSMEKPEEFLKEETQEIKRKRRNADEIKRKFKCYRKNCNKEYGLESSLVNHMKLKHSESQFDLPN